MDNDDPLLFGASTDPGIVAVEHIERPDHPDAMRIFVRKTEEIVSEDCPFEPFILLDDAACQECPGIAAVRELAGPGRLNRMASFTTWKECVNARSHLARKTGQSPSSVLAPYFFMNDPVQQYFTLSGRTLFLGMEFGALARMQVDIECFTSEGYEFCNPEREGDRIIAIAMADQSGWIRVLRGDRMSEKHILNEFVACVRERDPDVIEGHNIFNFDLPYIGRRAKLNGVKMALGRDGSVPRVRSSRFSAGERTISYSRYEIFGRHVVDTLFLTQSYDVSHRSLSGYGLKEVAVHFGFAAPDRTYLDGSRISEEFAARPEAIMAYVRDDVIETRELSYLLSQSSFAQARMFPFSYQSVCVRGTAVKIDALMVRAYLAENRAIPLPDEEHEFAGGYTDLFIEGVVKNVHHCDVRSLYPSLMLSGKLAPRTDNLGVFLRVLELLRNFRVEARKTMQETDNPTERSRFDAMQSTFKILINSFYGYLGFRQARFSDFDVAATVAERGRELLQQMIDWLKKHDAKPIEIDTDGIYFVPPPFSGSRKDAEAALGRFRKDFAKSLPKGIDIEFDGEFKAMYSYKMKNYALLGYDGEMVIKGAALKSRGLEPFQREFMESVLRMKLEKRENDIPALKMSLERDILDRKCSIQKLAKTESLQDSPASYEAKLKEGKGSRRAAYELALRSKRDYRAGDQVSYYVTGEKKSLAVHANCKQVSDWNPDERDENVAYYVAKLNALYKKFGGADVSAKQGELF